MTKFLFCIMYSFFFLFDKELVQKSMMLQFRRNSTYCNEDTGGCRCWFAGFSFCQFCKTKMHIGTRTYKKSPKWCSYFLKKDWLLNMILSSLNIIFLKHGNILFEYNVFFKHGNILFVHDFIRCYTLKLSHQE